jgi:hypothetical protein
MFLNEFLDLMFRSFWTFCGMWFLIATVMSLTLNFLFKAWNRFWRHWSIRKHGYPPRHCNADGDFHSVTENHQQVIDAAKRVVHAFENKTSLPSEFGRAINDLRKVTQGY